MSEEKGEQPSEKSERCHTPVVLVVGMAGSGKTTLVNALACHLDESPVPALARAEALVAKDTKPKPDASEAPETPGATGATGAADDDAADDDDEDYEPGAYVINLDPAVAELPYEPNVDIRDTIKYKDVMRDYKLGPNGAIITSLNLFATRFDQVLTLVEKRAPDVNAVIIDTPGQIETFTWSASGAIITEAVSSILPTVLLFVVDTPRSENAMTFVSNMLYACSIMYKTRLPMVVVFNKIDVQSSGFAEAWMRDFDAFDDALREENFAGTLARSMAQALEEFYSVMRSVSVSAATEEGLDELMTAVREAGEEYEREYRPALEVKKAELAEVEQERKAAQLRAIESDLRAERAGPVDSDRDTAWAPARRGSDAEDARDSMQPPKGGEHYNLGQGSERMKALRGERKTGSTSNQEKCGEGEEDVVAYGDFIKYLKAMNTNDDD